MGGEPIINKKFIKFVDWLIENNYTKLSLSFVSNGTVIDQSLIDKLKLFNSADIEISIESIHRNNHYIRQGSDTESILLNINKILNQQSENLKLVLRTVPQLLNVNNYHELILFAFEHNLSIQSIPLTTPSYLMITVLPYEIRQHFKHNYLRTIDIISKKQIIGKNTIAVGRDISRLNIQLLRECNTIIDILNQPEPDNVEELRNTLVNWLLRWDKLYNLDAREYYPEYLNFLETYGYHI